MVATQLPKKGNTRIEQKILSLWTNSSKDQKISYKQIVNTLKTDGVSERTVARHLLTLVEENKLEKVELGYNKTFYKPNELFWNTLGKSNDLFLIIEESLRRIGAYTINSLKTAKEEAHLWSEINSRLPENEKGDSTPAFAEAMDFVLKEKRLTDNELKELNTLVDSLIKGTVLRALTDQTVFSKLTPSDELPYVLQENIWKLVKQFMAVWVFLYKHPSGVPELENYLKKIIP